MIIDLQTRTLSLAQKIDDLALGALTAELACYPKPGLVSLHDRGSHADMDAATFIASIASLRGYFREMVEAGGDGADFRTLNEIGIAAEQKMMIATEGVNTHRGAVFSLGLIAAGAGYVIDQRLPCTADQVCTHVSRLWGADMIATLDQCQGTNGSAVRDRYGVPGAREHAAGGFRVLRQHALPAMRKAFRAGLDANWSGVHCFLESVAVLDDTNLLHRGGLDALTFARGRARSVLDAGGALTAKGRHHAGVLHSEFVAAWLSPGGSADMLAMCYFLHEFEKTFGA